MIRDTLAAAVESAAAGIGLDPQAVTWTMERPARREHGDWSCNIAMASAKAAGRSPRDIAGELVAALESADLDHVEAVEIAGPGFVNFRLAPTWLHDVLAEVVAGGEEGYARPDVGGGTKVNVEFVSANPNGPLHAGHGRGAAYGDSVARILERAGFDVTREFYLNDRGVQMQRYAESLLARKRGEPVPEGGYAGEYVSDWAAEMPDEVADAVSMRCGSGATTGRSPTSARSSPPSTCTTTSGRPSRRWSTAVRWMRRSPSCASGARLRRGGRHVAAVHGLRGRQGPPARQVRRRPHLPAARHRLPPGQVRPGLRPAHRRLGRRPPQLRDEDEGGDPGPRPRSRRVRGADRADRAASSARARRSSSPSGPATSSSSATSSTRSAPTSPASPTCCSRSTASRPSTSTSSRSAPTTTRSSTSSTPTPGSTRSWARPPRPASSGCRWPTPTCRCSSTSGRSSCCARLSEPARDARAGRSRAGAAHRHQLGARARRPVPRLLPRLLRDRGRAAGAAPRPACGWSSRPASASPSASTCSASRPRSRCSRGRAPPDPPPPRALDHRSGRSAVDRRLRRARRRRRVRDAPVRVRRGSTCATGAARRSPPSPTASPTPRRRSSAWPWRGWPTRRAWTSTSPPAARCTSRSPPGCRPRSWSCTATTSRWPSWPRPGPTVSAGSSSTASTSSSASTRLHQDDGLAPKVLLRITPGIEAHTHEFVMTGQEDSKFGFGLRSGAAGRAIERGVGVAGGGPGRASTCTSARRCSWPTPSTTRSRRWSRSSRPTTSPSSASAAASASPTSRARRRRRWPTGAAPSRPLPGRPASRHASPPSPAGRSPLRRR